MHSWNVGPAEAIAIQKELARRVRCEGKLEQVNTVGGVDVGFRGGAGNDCSVKAFTG